MASPSSGAVNRIERAHQMYREGKYKEALVFYTDALSMAKSKPQKIALHSNRAACYLKLHDFKQAAEECTSVIELDYNHTGALMLRAQTLVTLKEYHSALFDVTRLIELNPSSEVYRNLQARLKSQLRMSVFVQGKSLASIPEDDAELEEEEDEDDIEQEVELEDIREVEESEDGGDVVEEVTADEHEVEKISPKAEVPTVNKNTEKLSDEKSSGWQAIPKPKGHSQLDYSRWDTVEDDSSEDDDDEEDEDESPPQYRFRVKTVGVRAVK